MSWFTDDRPEAAIAYWQNAYPGMGNEAENIAWLTDKTYVTS